MIAIVLNILLLGILIYSLFKKKNIITFGVISVLAFNLMVHIDIQKSPEKYYKVYPGEYMKFEDSKIIAKDKNIEGVELENGEKIDLTQPNNQFVVTQQYHTKNTEVHAIEVTQVIRNKALSFLSGAPKEIRGNFIEIAVPMEK